VLSPHVPDWNLLFIAVLDCYSEDLLRQEDPLSVVAERTMVKSGLRTMSIRRTSCEWSSSPRACRQIPWRYSQHVGEDEILILHNSHVVAVHRAPGHNEDAGYICDQNEIGLLATSNTSIITTEPCLSLSAWASNSLNASEPGISITATKEQSRSQVWAAHLQFGNRAPVLLFAFLEQVSPRGHTNSHDNPHF
jgi:hypothetical protein